MDPSISDSRFWAPNYSTVLGLTRHGAGPWRARGIGTGMCASLGDGTNTRLSAGQEDRQHTQEKLSIETRGCCRTGQRGAKDGPG